MPLSLREWLRTASPKNQNRLAKLAKTSVPTLKNIVSGFRKGSADTAVRVGLAAEKLRVEDPSLEAIDQRSICPACRRCPFHPKG